MTNPNQVLFSDEENQIVLDEISALESESDNGKVNKKSKTSFILDIYYKIVTETWRENEFIHKTYKIDSEVQKKKFK